VDVTVAVATYGARRWPRLAIERAIPSAEVLGVPVVHVHGATLHDARNQALDRVETEWVCHLDADDELEPGFFDAIARSSADLRAPAVRYVRPARASTARPSMPRVAGHRHDCSAACLPDGNWLVVGTVARAALLRDVGGWRDWSLYEDWDLWLRCHLAGATVEAIPHAIYRAHARPDSRNRAPSIAQKNRVHHLIVADLLGTETHTSKETTHAQVP
jgi:glycosyltransferase involved in cell wall biosynthesis